MYRNCYWKNCGCNNNSNADVLEDICDDVSDVSYENDTDNCFCGFDEDVSPFTDYPMYGHTYVPVQKINKTFTPCVGLKMGTIFPELVSPYEANQSICEIEYLKNANEIKEGCNNGRN